MSCRVSCGGVGHGALSVYRAVGLVCPSVCSSVRQVKSVLVLSVYAFFVMGTPSSLPAQALPQPPGCPLTKPTPKLPLPTLARQWATSSFANQNRPERKRGKRPLVGTGSSLSPSQCLFYGGPDNTNRFTQNSFDSIKVDSLFHCPLPANSGLRVTSFDRGQTRQDKTRQDNFILSLSSSTFAPGNNTTTSFFPSGTTHGG